ncbi:hypothetical protein R1sor_003709 [Riccia sorocarpa]|uniref:Uncharacterized protein n=1 Tax=Riccia sorocarpa TaxID=122646 RepID=A0ABD3H5A0_9MARC
MSGTTAIPGEARITSNEQKGVDPILKQILTEQVSPEIQEGVEETLSATEYYIAKRHKGAPVGISTLIPATAKVINTNTPIVLPVTAQSTTLMASQDQAVVGDSDRVAEPTVSRGNERESSREGRNLLAAVWFRVGEKDLRERYVKMLNFRELYQEMCAVSGTEKNMAEKNIEKAFR